MNYYHFVRREIQPLLPENATSILDVGAGAGSTSRWLKTIYPKAEITGVEVNSALEEELKLNVDVMLIGAIDDVLPQLKRYDLILMLDVLEHLAHPTTTLRELSNRLKSDGHVIVSVPNIAHLSVSLPLLLQRRFEYQDAGILDRTHLRFFVEDGAIKLMNDASFMVTKGLISGLRGPKSRILDRLSFGLLRHHLTRQYIMLGRPTGSNPDQRAVRWTIAE